MHNYDWAFLFGPGLVVGFGNGILLGYLMYRSALVPPRMEPGFWHLETFLYLSDVDEDCAPPRLVPNPKATVPYDQLYEHEIVAQS